MAKLSPEEKLKRLRNDILTKLSKSFSSAYISNAGYVIPVEAVGKDTLTVTRMAVIKEDVLGVLCPEFSDSSCKYVKMMNIKDIKKEEEDDGWSGVFPVVDNSEELDNAFAALEKIIIRDNPEWEALNLSDNELDLLYDLNAMVNLKGIQEAKGKDIVITKEMFPYTKKDTIKSVVSVCMGSSGEDLFSMTLRTDTTYFTLYNQFYFI